MPPFPFSIPEHVPDTPDKLVAHMRKVVEAHPDHGYEAVRDFLFGLPEPMAFAYVNWIGQQEDLPPLVFDFLECGLQPDVAANVSRLVADLEAKRADRLAGLEPEPLEAQGVVVPHPRTVRMALFEAIGDSSSAKLIREAWSAQRFRACTTQGGTGKAQQDEEEDPQAAQTEAQEVPVKQVSVAKTAPKKQLLRTPSYILGFTREFDIPHPDDLEYPSKLVRLGPYPWRLIIFALLTHPVMHRGINKLGSPPAEAFTIANEFLRRWPSSWDVTSASVIVLDPLLRPLCKELQKLADRKTFITYFNEDGTIDESRSNLTPRNLTDDIFKFCRRWQDFDLKLANLSTFTDVTDTQATKDDCKKNIHALLNNCDVFDDKNEGWYVREVYSIFGGITLNDGTLFYLKTDEWKALRPRDRGLRDFLAWAWATIGYAWDPETGNMTTVEFEEEDDNGRVDVGEARQVILKAIQDARKENGENRLPKKKKARYSK